MPTAVVRDIELHYEVSGEGEPLLFIHGLGSSARDWEFQIPHFADRYRIVTLDLRGHGRSEKPSGPYGVSMFADDIAELLVTLDLGPVHVVGISLGGFVASQLAVDHGSLLRSLVLVNSTPELPADTWLDRWRTRRALLARRLVVRLFGMRGLARLLSKKLLPHSDHGHLRNLFVERWAENDPRAYQKTVAAISRWSVRDRLESILCPTYVISGENDFFPRALKEEWVTRSGARMVVIPDSGHLTPIDQPEQFNRVLREFLDDHAPSPGA